MSIAKSLFIGKKSRSDGILLTGGFNLRLRNALHSPPSPAGTTLWRVKVSSLRDLEGGLFSLLRLSQMLFIHELHEFTRILYFENQQDRK